MTNYSAFHWSEKARKSAESSQEHSDESKQWAVGEPTEPEEHSAKWWAQQSSRVVYQINTSGDSGVLTEEQIGYVSDESAIYRFVNEGEVYYLVNTLSSLSYKTFINIDIALTESITTKAIYVQLNPEAGNYGRWSKEDISLDAYTKTEIDGLLAQKQGTISDLSDIRSGAGLGATSLQPSDVKNNITSTDTNKPLSANMGKELQDQITNLKSRGRYLSVWNCTTGLAGTTPISPLPYEYKTGDYFIVGVVGTTNYKPNGTQYTGTSSTTVETGTVNVNDTYFYDGSSWSLLSSGGQVTATFSSLGGSPYDNTNLASELNGKQPTLVSGTTIKTINGSTILGSGNISINQKTFNILDFKWSDYELNDQNWLRSDTFSWQSGTVYSQAYNHLVADLVDATASIETVGSYSLTVYTATDGHKIVLDDEATTVENIFTESGVAWYYIVDTTNTRFKLPRSTYNKYSKELPVKGDGKSTGFIDGNGKLASLTAYGYSGSEVFFGHGTYNSSNLPASTTAMSSTARDIWGLSTNSNESGIIASSVSDSNMHLYFYVGQFSQTATEQTAGLNAGLFNGKADLDAANLSTQGKSTVSGFGMPGDRYIDLTLGASDAQYTAPANGWVALRLTSNSSHAIAWLYTKEGNFTSLQWETSGNSISIFIPVVKNSVFIAGYQGFKSFGSGNNDYFRFYPAEGEPNV